MQQQVAHVALVVRDYDEAIAFYTQKLGFQLVADTPLGGGKRWVLVAPPGTWASPTTLLLAQADGPEQLTRVGNQTGGRVFLFLTTDDFWRDYHRLVAQGVQFQEAPRQEAYATVAVFADLYGNRWDLLQPTAAPAPYLPTLTGGIPAALLLEMTTDLALNFQKMPDQLVPAIVQDAATGQVLMLGYFNAEAWARTQAEGRVTFFSRSRQRLWTKGETSGHYLHVVSLHVDCDQDTVLVMAQPEGPTCHRGTTSCFEPLAGAGGVGTAALLPAPAVGFLAELDQLIEQRRLNPAAEPGSYTVRLLEKGLARIAQKVGEEAVETIIEAMAGDRAGLPGEAADLLYHLLVLLRASGSSLAEMLAVLRQRHQTIAAGQRRPLPE